MHPMKILILAVLLILATSSAGAVEFQDDVLRYGGTLSSVNAAGDEITVRDTPRGAQRTIRVEPRLAQTLREGSTIDLPAVSAGTISRNEASTSSLAASPSEAASADS
jgi:hypothetical protein